MPPQDSGPSGIKWTALKYTKVVLKPGRLVQFLLSKETNNTCNGDKEAAELFEMWSELKDSVVRPPVGASHSSSMMV